MRFITIEREYGSGGTKIARELAAKAQIPCYGEEILAEAAKNLNVTVEQMRDYEETTTGSFLYSIYLLSQSISGNSDMLSNDGKIFVQEQKVIQKFAIRGSSIFLGHCASEALKESSDLIKVFIHGDKASKRKRILEDYGIKESQIDSVEKKNNKRRANYYHANTQKQWDDFHSYDIVLDSTTLGIQGCVDVLAGLL